MATAPGHAGMPIVGDKSLEFYKDAVKFVDKRIEQYESRVFLTRLLNKHTYVVASNAGVQQLLHESDGCLEPGYKSFMHGVYGDNVIFTNGNEAQELRQILHSLFTTEALEQFQVTIKRLTIKALDQIKPDQLTDVYPIFKRLCTEICLSIFLGVDFETSAEIAEDIVNLTTTHWHGIISVPLTVRLPGMNTTSSYTKALEAKAKLLAIISDQLESSRYGFPSSLLHCGFKQYHMAVNHILLFTSALVPKALASIMTSFTFAVGNDVELQHSMLQDRELKHRTLLEVQRMWPPFFGGRRLARRDFKIEGYRISSGTAVVYMTRHAQRDPDIFEQPDVFMPERWVKKNANDQDKLFLFGGGPRCCIGQQLVSNILQMVTQSLLERYHWTSVKSPDDLKYKWLPVSRPVDNVPVVFSTKGSETVESQDEFVLASEN